MDTEPSDGELLLATYHGRCGHRRQHGLPCATPKCKQGQPLYDITVLVSHHRKCVLTFKRAKVAFGDEIHYVWRKVS